jgi:uncharacterized protein (DUF427 family)
VSDEAIEPANVVTPGPGQESVWDYPRPPIVEPVAERIRVEFAGIVVADTTRGLRVLETSSPPAYYLPPADVRTEFLHLMAHHTVCEWKGLATYWTLSVRGREQEAAAWSYPSPGEGYAELRDYLAFYAGRTDACFLGDEQATPQAGDYHGGWITSKIAGPFKGGPGSDRW